MKTKRVMQKAIFPIAIMLLVSFACASPTDLNSLISFPTATQIDIQEVVEKTLNAYTAIAVDHQAGTPIPNGASELALEPTNSATRTIPTPTETLTPSPTTTPTADLRGTCHYPYPYFPIRTDVNWQYSEDASGAPTSEFSIHYGSITDETFIAFQEFETATIETNWLCSTQGLMQSKYTQRNIPGIPDGIEFETINYDGITLPTPEQFQVGATWSSSYTIRGTMNTDVGEMTTTTEINIANTLAAFEEVTVPFGVYPNAARVDAQITMLISTQVGGFAGPPTEITSIMSTWYAEGAGMVKTVSEEQGGNTILELISMK
jgi:hypothetical protein